MTKPAKYGCLADQPHKLLHPNYSGQSHRSARDAFGHSLPTEGDGSRPVADDYKGVLIFLAIMAVTFVIGYFIHPHWSAHEPTRPVPQRADSRVSLAGQHPEQVRH